MKLKIPFLVLMLFTGTCFDGVQAQQSAKSRQFPLLKGRVTDAVTGKPIAGARIIVGGKGAVSDKDGRFALRLFGREYGDVFAVRVSADGYQIAWYREVVIDDPKEIVLNPRLRKKQRKVERIFRLQHRLPSEVMQVLASSFKIRDNIRASDKLMTITATHYPHKLAQLDSLIRALDQPLKKIWLEVKLIRAVADESQPLFIDPQIAPIARNLSSLFRFRQYYLVAQATALGLEGNPLEIQAAAKDTSKTRLQFKVTTIPKYHNGIIKLENLSIQWWRPAFISTSPKSNFTTTLNLKPNETVILGSSQGQSQHDTIISVVTTKVLESQADTR